MGNLTRQDILQMVIDDMESDVEAFVGKPFTGQTLGELHGTICATIRALAQIVKSQGETISRLESEHTDD